MCHTAMFTSLSYFVFNKNAKKWNMKICGVLRIKFFYQNLWESKRFSAQRLIKKYPHKNWKTNIGWLSQKVAHNQFIERTAESRRPQSFRTADTTATTEHTVKVKL